MFGIGGFELFIILLFGFLVFGPDKLPDIARTIGMAIGKFRKAQEEMNAVIKNEVLDPNADPSSRGARSSRSSASHPQETFAQRKARYDRERAAREQREQIQANREQMKRDAARARDERLAKAKATESHQSDENQEEDQLQVSAETRPTDKPSVKPTLTPDELFGNKPIPLQMSSASQSQDDAMHDSHQNRAQKGGA